VGGLNHYIASLKEVVILPLLYPEMYERLGISPPRGVLFSGPPGTGKVRFTDAAEGFSQLTSRIDSCSTGSGRRMQQDGKECGLLCSKRK
jgi:ATP-dependent Zn protease